MRSLILQGDNNATERPDDAQLEAMEPFVQLGELPIPEPGGGQVRIKVALASVNPSDEMFIQGLSANLASRATRPGSRASAKWLGPAGGLCPT